MIQAQIVVQLNHDGTINVSAPLENKLLCYGLLEVAKDLVRDHKPALVQTAPAEVLRGLNGGSRAER